MRLLSGKSNTNSSSALEQKDLSSSNVQSNGKTCFNRLYLLNYHLHKAIYYLVTIYILFISIIYLFSYIILFK